MKRQGNQAEDKCDEKEFHPSSQKNEASSYWPRLNTEKQAWIDWSWKGEDIYKFTNFPFFALPKLNFNEYSQKQIKYNRSMKNDNFWRTCFNSEYICINHDEDVKFETKGRILFISKK